MAHGANTSAGAGVSFLDAVVQFRCTLCEAPMGECDCWHQCECGWFYPDGGECSNPTHNETPTSLQVTPSPESDPA